MRYTMTMAKQVSFSLDLGAAGDVILRGMVQPIIRQSGEAIRARAESMAHALSQNPDVEFTTQTNIGTIRQGRRVITTVSASYGSAHDEYIARQALAKARDAGRLK